VPLGVPGRLRPRIIKTFGITKVVGCQPKAPAAFTPGEIPGTHFQRLNRPQGTWFCRKEPRKKSQVTPPGIDPGTVRLVAQRLNHYATPATELIHITALTLLNKLRISNESSDTPDTGSCLLTFPFFPRASNFVAHVSVRCEKDPP
jgi:hypothetical protein